VSADLPIRQVAYFVPDVRAAARAHHALYGSGPYFVAEHIALRCALYRGVAGTLDHTSAYGQWGPVMIEFVQQHDAGNSAFHDMYPMGSGRSGLHHVALFVKDLAAAIARQNAAGFATELYAEMHDGFAFAMLDHVAASGHMVELYEPLPALTGFYERVATAAREFDGADLIRPIAFD
jgi:hypothetical protein